MSAAPAPVSPLPPLAQAWRELGWLPRANLLVLAGLTAVLTALLWPHWRDNPDLSHGYVAPFVFFLLLHEARNGTPRFLAPSAKTRGAVAGWVTLGLLGLCASGLYAASLDWSHSLVACTLTITVVCLLTAGLVAFATTTPRLLPFNWSATVAVLLWLLSAPIPPGTYTRLTLGLQLMVTENVLRALHILGVAATRQGNIIELAMTSVGVEEACSGVRSLISCVFAGLFFSATLVRRPWARGLIIGLSAVLAIGMNFLRSLTLTLLANAGVDIAGAWHDVTGFAVLGVTAALLGGLALLLEHGTSGRTGSTQPPPENGPAPVPAPSPARPRASVQLILAPALTLTVALSLFFYANTRPSIRQGLSIPDLPGILPAQVDGWRVDTSEDLYQFANTLKTDHLAERTYLRRTADGVEQITVYLAYWRAGQAPVSLVASHTPDACWPGSGWVPAPIPAAREQLTVADRPLAAAEARVFLSGEFPQYVWFWHLYDGRPIAYRDPYSARELLRIAWRYGFTHDGDQLFVRVSSNRPWNEVAAEPLLAEIFTRLQPLGL